MTNKIFLKEFSESVSIRFKSPTNPLCLIILAHGAGNNIDSTFMTLIQDYLEKNRVASFCFNFIYKEKGKKLPNSKKSLSKEYRAMFHYIKTKYQNIPIFIGGKSMGGRISTLIVRDLPEVKGLVFLGFPIHAPGKPDKMVGDYIFEITKPMLFLQGTRDNFSKKVVVEEFIPQLQKAEIYWLEDGDHSWKPKKSSLKTQNQLIGEAAEVIHKFCKKILQE